MKYRPMQDYELDTLKREISKSLSSRNSSSNTVSDASRRMESALQDLRRALSSLERNTDSRIRELQQKASAASKSFSSYSSYESGIRADRSEVDRAVSKISDLLRAISGNSGYGYSSYSDGDAARKLDTLVEALKEANSELQAGNRQIDQLDKENKELRRENGCLGSDVAKMTAGAALAAAAGQQEKRRVHRNAEQMIARLKQDYEKEIRTLRESLSLEASENAALAAALAARNNLDDDNWEPMSPGLSIAEDYAILWNGILEDDVIDLREVRHIQKWLAKNKLEVQGAFELAQCCESIIARGEVLGSDFQHLYDYSFILLSSLGAKVAN